MILIFLGLWTICELGQHTFGLSSNPISPFLVISYPLPLQADEAYHRYGKGNKDLLFLGFYIIVFSFIRQTITEYLIKPYAAWLGLKGTKQQRFIEQGYAVFYWGSSTLIGLVSWRCFLNPIQSEACFDPWSESQSKSVMSKQPTWWYNTSEFWKSYPHDRMEPSVKTYYLLQFSYWLQQMLLLSLRIEKPRSDFVELVIHVSLHSIPRPQLLDSRRVRTDWLLISIALCHLVACRMVLSHQSWGLRLALSPLIILIDLPSSSFFLFFCFLTSSHHDRYRHLCQHGHLWHFFGCESQQLFCVFCSSLRLVS